MNKPQWITLSVAALAAVSLFAGTQNRIFGDAPAKPVEAHSADDGHNHGAAPNAITADSLLFYAKKNLPQNTLNQLRLLEGAWAQAKPEDKQHSLHELARYWADSARAYTPLAWYPYAWYTAEAARLENSEKSLSFAAHLFLNALSQEEDPRVKQWDALQAKELFERSLKLNSENDSSKIGLGATILYGGLEAPMKGIGMIREVAQKDSTNVFAQLTLGEASLLSGQLNKAVERFAAVVRLQPQNLQAILLLADTHEKMNQKPEAITWYGKSLPLITVPEMRKEVEKRITQLKIK